MTITEFAGYKGTRPCQRCGAVGAEETRHRRQVHHVVPTLRKAIRGRLFRSAHTVIQSLRIGSGSIGFISASC